jgi:hypothetical protein
MCTNQKLTCCACWTKLRRRLSRPTEQAMAPGMPPAVQPQQHACKISNLPRLQTQQSDHAPARTLTLATDRTPAAGTCGGPAATGMSQHCCQGTALRALRTGERATSCCYWRTTLRWDGARPHSTSWTFATLQPMHPSAPFTHWCRPCVPRLAPSGGAADAATVPGESGQLRDAQV